VSETPMADDRQLAYCLRFTLSLFVASLISYGKAPKLRLPDTPFPFVGKLRCRTTGYQVAKLRNLRRAALYNISANKKNRMNFHVSGLPDIPDCHGFMKLPKSLRSLQISSELLVARVSQDMK